MSFFSTDSDWEINSALGDSSIVLEIFVLLKYLFKASICDSILIPKAIAFFGMLLVLLVIEINVILFISLSLSKLS